MWKITTKGKRGNRGKARVKSYEEVLREYEFHPESKCADSHGNTCGKATIGLLYRRHVRVGWITYIGKESNQIEDVESGLVHNSSSIYTEYMDLRRDEWQSIILPILKKRPLAEIQRVSGLSRATLQRIRAGRRPNPKNEAILRTLARACIGVLAAELRAGLGPNSTGGRTSAWSELSSAEHSAPV